MSFVSTLSKIVPPPRYIMLPGYGIDISDTSLKYIKLADAKNSYDEFTIADWGEIIIPSGVLEQGSITDPRQLTKVLQEFKTRTRAEFVRVALPEEQAYIFETSIKQGITSTEMQNLLEFRLEENVPISSREVLFDYTIEESDTENRSIQVVVVAYARDIVMQYNDACLAAGLVPTTFEVEAQAMARAVVPSDIVGATMMVDFGKTRTGIGIVINGTLRYTSTIDIGGMHLSVALRKTLGDKSESELTIIKNTEGLVRRHDSSAVYEALLPLVSVIRDEIAQRMHYWHAHNHLHPNRRITNVILCGGSSNLKGLPEYFSHTLKVPAVRANVWQHILRPAYSVPPIDLYHSFGYATALGLALRTTI